MFGLKIRSWMENHIVRPRKKGNKNKNGNSGNLVTSISTQNGYKGTSSQGDATIASPARRSEVSPIQYHTTSRAGWHTPDDDVLSPKSDHLHPHFNMVKSLTTSPKSIFRKKSSNLETHVTSHHNSYSKSVDSNQYNHTVEVVTLKQSDFTPMTTIMTTKSQESTSKFTAANMSNQSHTLSYCSTTTTSSSSSEMLEQRTVNRFEYDSHGYRGMYDGGRMNGSALQHSVNGGTNIAYQQNHQSVTNMTKYEMPYQYASSKSNQQAHQNDDNQQSITESKRQPSATIVNGCGSRNRTPYDEYQVQTHDLNGCEGRYGKLLSRTLNNENHHSMATNTNNNQAQTHDRYNANVQYQSQPSKLINGVDNCTNNNSTIQLHVTKVNGYSNFTSLPPSTTAATVSNGISSSGGKMAPPMGYGNGGGTVTTVVTRPPNKDGVNGNGYLRGPPSHHRYSNGHLAAPGNHPLAHLIGSLSSPESAYSTGYSTDGTSPGTTNTPEYYINMRTGTHYFPRGVNGVAAVERSRQKFGLNKIDEAVAEGTALVNHNSHRRTESCDLGRRPPMRATNPVGSMATDNGLNGKDAQGYAISRGLSPDLHRRLAYQNYKGMESPSPRQRSRIRTNPWFTSIDPVTNGCNNSSINKRLDADTSSTSSGVKSGTDEKRHKNKAHISSESESTSTEVEVSSKRILTPNTIRRRRSDKQVSECIRREPVDSEDEDATFNEMMGKFDESYIYEKETDILSDSDPTECNSDLDTGLDGGDECDTDELLDIDYIDTGSVHEVSDNHIYQNTGSCTYHSVQADKKTPKLQRSRKQQSEEGSRRKKKLIRRKRSTDCRDTSQNSQKTDSPNRSRESRSLGGTPVSLRRNQSAGGKRSPKMAPLSNRCNSLTFTEIHSVRSKYLAIAESEKALLKADIEADVKYKQLIHEAETILVSMKTTALRETPVPSPRRVCNVPANKRVEMLRNCEADLRRELSKTQKQSETLTDGLRKEIIDHHHGALLKTIPPEHNPHMKRVEELRHEVPSVPGSPKSARFSPRKTHVTNFINQCGSSVELIRRRSSPEPLKPSTDIIPSPYLQLNGVEILSPPKSPKLRRRYRSQSPRVCIDESESDSDNRNKNSSSSRKWNGGHAKNEINGNVDSGIKKSHRKIRKDTTNDDILNQNAVAIHGTGRQGNTAHLIQSFNLIDMANKCPQNYYCPQSEPLKRKVYSEKTLERLQKSLELESEIPKKALLQKISQLRLERQAAKAQTDNTTSECLGTIEHPVHESAAPSNGNVQQLTKRQLILNTIEDLKRSLEDQSVELNGLNEDD